MFIFTILQYALLAWFGYWFLISLFGFGRAGSSTVRRSQKRFMVLIPAHNEETVIGDIVENLALMEYPKHLYTVCVIADNSSDETARIARDLGAVVLEHTSLPGEDKGKPYAIKYALDTLDLNGYDAICVFDADNLVTLNYLQEMNQHLLQGEKLIQCYLDSKNPEDNVIASGYAASYYFMNRSWQLAKYRIGLGNTIGGTGFCVDMKLLDKVGWTARSLTEDLEFTMQCLLIGQKATWCHNARVYDEKPTNFIASCVQRLRWARGHWDVCSKYALPLLKRAVTRFDLNSFDGVMYLLNPGKIVVGTMAGAFFYFCYFSGSDLVHPLLPMKVWLFFIAFNLVYVFLSLRDSMQPLNAVNAFVSLYIVNLTYIPLFVWSLFTMNRRIWIRTEHKRSASITDMSA